MTVDNLDQKTGVVAVNSEQAMQLVTQIQESVAKQDANAFFALLDTNVFFDRVFSGLEVSEASRSGFMKGVNQSGGLRALMQQITAQAAAGGSYRFVRLVESDEGLHPLFRLSIPEGGHNYHRLIPTNATGTVRIADMHIMLTGELMSATLRRSAIQLAAHENRSFAERLTGEEADFIKHAQDVSKLAEAAKAGDFSGFMARYQTLPDSLQNDHNVLILRMMVSQSTPSAYAEALEALETAFPDDPSNDFRAIDRYAMKEDFPSALAAVDRLIASTQDPFLNTLRVDPLLKLERPEEALKAAELALAAEPDNIDGYWVALGAALLTKDYARVTELMTIVQKQFGMEFGDLSTIPEYADFAKSPEYEKWISQQ